MTRDPRWHREKNGVHGTAWPRAPSWNGAARALSAGALTLASMGCARDMAQVRVRDPKHVFVQINDFARVPIRPADDGVVVAHGEDERSKYQYPVSVQLDGSGGITLACPLCNDQHYFREPVDPMPLFDADGLSREVRSERVVVGDKEVVIGFDLCLVSVGYRPVRCLLDGAPRLVVNMEDVVEVQRRVIRDRNVGYAFLGGGITFLAMGAIFFAAATDKNPLKVGAAICAIESLPLLTIGLWATFAPATETIWRPPAIR